ncbi:hypothetical protein [Streptomyces kronopolitis]
MLLRDRVFQTLMDAMIAEAAARDDVDLGWSAWTPPSPPHVATRAGTAVAPELLEDLEKAVTEEKGLRQ